MSDNNCDPNYKHADFSKYRFEPSVGVNVFMGLTSLLLMGEIIGYIGRAIGARENPGCWTLGPFVIQSLLILIAPALMAASVYMILGRIILLTEGEKFALIRQRRLTKVFVTGDIVSLWIQSSVVSGS
ncbi:hypothetical protein FOPG_15789 [Fusarium oxysporum f. sp. conglutinans race 2 54008]|uniref:Sphingoid long-chain base transporter RSB1 n=1 Tax=Fusarium oxysporum f. sp. conglutinans race 2 54008 TaxID=1089457 RepID=X0GWW2_FUSOX|nr:hypothetical protein FOPG_15789 [Fusarium oxysporum f. sp. conglutinans race 2 54008]